MKVEDLEEGYKIGLIPEKDYFNLKNLLSLFPNELWIESDIQQIEFDELLIDKVIIKYGVSFSYMQPEIN